MRHRYQYLRLALINGVYFWEVADMKTGVISWRRA